MNNEQPNFNNVETKEIKPKVDEALTKNIPEETGVEKTTSEKEKEKYIKGTFTRQKERTVRGRIQKFFEKKIQPLVEAKPFSKLSEKEKEKLMLKGNLQINLNPAVKAEFDKLKISNPEKAEKFQVAMGRFQYAKWDKEKEDFVDTAGYTAHMDS
jgi:hypothetical protein